jgi:hypothetical protein
VEEQAAFMAPAMAWSASALSGPNGGGQEATTSKLGQLAAFGTPADDSADTARVGPAPALRNGSRGRLLVMVGSAVALLAFILVGGSVLIFGKAIGNGEPVGGIQQPRPATSTSPAIPPSDPPATPSVEPSTSDGAGTGDLTGPANNGSNSGNGTGNGTGSGKGKKPKNNNGNGNPNPSDSPPDMPSFPAFPPFPTPTFTFPAPPSFPTYP